MSLSPSFLGFGNARDKFGRVFDSGAAFVGPLDEYPAGGAWSVARRLFSSYTGPLVRVRRSSDNDEMPINPHPDGSLNTDALLTFAGSGNGFVTTIYDQMGLNDFVQPSAADQMIIVNNGSLVTVGGIPAVNNPGAKWMTSSAAVSWRHWFCFHDTGASITDGGYLFDGRTDLAESYVFDQVIFGSNWISVRKNGVDSTLDGSGVFDAAAHLTTMLGTDSTPTAPLFLRFYGFNAGNRIGSLREIVTYDTPLDDATRDAVEAALMP